MPVAPRRFLSQYDESIRRNDRFRANQNFPEMTAIRAQSGRLIDRSRMSAMGSFAVSPFSNLDLAETDDQSTDRAHRRSPSSKGEGAKFSTAAIAERWRGTIEPASPVTKSGSDRRGEAALGAEPPRARARAINCISAIIHGASGTEGGTRAVLTGPRGGGGELNSSPAGRPKDRCDLNNSHSQLRS